MTGEDLADQSVYGAIVAANIKQIEDFTTGDRNGFTTLPLVDISTWEPVNGLIECDNFNRNMLLAVYERLGIDPDTPSLTRQTDYANGDRVNERVFHVGDRTDITEATYAGIDSAGQKYETFNVKVAKIQ